MIISRERAAEILSDIACDSDERTPDRLKAIEMLSGYHRDEDKGKDYSLVIVDDVSQELES